MKKHGAIRGFLLASATIMTLAYVASAAAGGQDSTNQDSNEQHLKSRVSPAEILRCANIAESVRWQSEVQSATEPIDLQLAQAYRDQFIQSKLSSKAHEAYHKFIEKIQEAVDFNKRAGLLSRRVEIVYSVNEKYSYDELAEFSRKPAKSKDGERNDVTLYTASQSLITGIIYNKLGTLEGSHSNTGLNVDDVDNTKGVVAKLVIKHKDFDGAIKGVVYLDSLVDAESRDIVAKIDAIKTEREKAVAAAKHDLLATGQFCRAQWVWADDSKRTKVWSLEWGDEGRDHAGVVTLISGLRSEAEAVTLANENEFCKFKHQPMIGACILGKANGYSNQKWYFMARNGDKDERSWPISEGFDSPEVAIAHMAYASACHDKGSYEAYLSLK